MNEFAILFNRLTKSCRIATKDIQRRARVTHGQIVQWSHGKAYPTYNECIRLQRIFGSKAHGLWETVLRCTERAQRAFTSPVIDHIAECTKPQAIQENALQTPQNAKQEHMDSEPCICEQVSVESDDKSNDVEVKPMGSERFAISNRVVVNSYTASLGACDALVTHGSGYIELTNGLCGVVAYDDIQLLIEDLEWLLKNRGVCPV